MIILHILNDGPDPLSQSVRKIQSKDHTVEVIDLSRDEVSYETIVEKIFNADRVVSW